MVQRFLVLLAAVVLAGFAFAHGGVGIPTLQMLTPAPGEIVDAVDDRLALRWIDADPDDNANVHLVYSPGLDDPEVGVDIARMLPEDCDPSDAGPVFVGMADGGEMQATLDQDQLNQQFCRSHQDLLGCHPDNDCFMWDTTNVPSGIYQILGVIDDHWPDGGGGTASFAFSRGLVRVAHPGENVPPAMIVVQPDGVADAVSTCFRVRWKDSDPDDDARINLYVKRAFSTQPMILVAQGLSEDDLENGFDLDMSGAVDLVDYEIWGEIDDGHRPAKRMKSQGFITRYNARPSDGGCLGAPPAWPDGSAWPVRDAGSGDAASRPDASTPEAGTARADASIEGPQPPPGCPNCDAAAWGPMTSFLLMPLFRRMSRPRRQR